MSVLLAFAALLALVSAQCSLQGNTYASDNGSVTFGVAVGEWIPTIFNPTDASTVHFGTVKNVYASRYEVRTTATANGEAPDVVGQYNVQIIGDCTTLVLTAIEDSWDEREEFLTASSFTYVEHPVGGDCITVGTKLSSNFGKSEISPIIATQAVTWVFGLEEFAIASVGRTTAIFQRWAFNWLNETALTEVRDFASVPAGFSCPSSKIGVYSGAWDRACNNRFCGVTDGCFSRAQLLSGAIFNDWEAEEDEEPCAELELPGFGGESKCSANAQQWSDHPDECVNQFEGGECMFCRGVAGGEEVSVCLDRLGAQCDDVFNTYARQSFCNLAFECPASTATLSLVVFISAFLALFLR